MLHSCSHGAGQADQQSWVNLCWLQLQEASLGLLQDPAQGSIVVLPHLGQVGVEQGDGCIAHQPGLSGCQSKLLSCQKCLSSMQGPSVRQEEESIGRAACQALQEQECNALEEQSGQPFLTGPGHKHIMCSASGSRRPKQVRR